MVVRKRGLLVENALAVRGNDPDWSQKKPGLSRLLMKHIWELSGDGDCSTSGVPFLCSRFDQRWAGWVKLSEYPDREATSLEWAGSAVHPGLLLRD